MRRPDLAHAKYDGWQVVDPTPQEKSDGIVSVTGLHKLKLLPSLAFMALFVAVLALLKMTLCTEVFYRVI